MTIEDVHKRIKDLLEERGWTLYKLADECKLPHTSLYTIMQRHTMPKLDTLDTICKGFGITLSDFFISFSKPQKEGYFSKKEQMLLEITRSFPEKNMDLVLAYAKGVKDSTKGSG